MKLLLNCSPAPATSWEYCSAYLIAFLRKCVRAGNQDGWRERRREEGDRDDKRYNRKKNKINVTDDDGGGRNK